MASHDLQEPLRAIVGFLQLLETRYAGRLDEKGHHYIERSVKAGHRMQNLINDLLVLSKIDTRGGGLEATDLNEVMTRVRKRFHGFAQDTGAVIESEGLSIIQADPGQMFTLFANLVSNALKYNTSSCPEVKIGMTGENDDLSFYVADNGIGIDEKFYDRIFVVFQRLHGKDEYSGTGIGLTLCKKIVERHGGKIWVESEQGRGSTFFFTLNKGADQ